MKKLFIIGLLVALLLIAMPAMAATTPLYAGQNIEVGYVDISIIGDEMTVTIRS